MKMYMLKFIDNLYKVTKRAQLKSIVRLGEKVYSLKDNYIFSILDDLKIEEDYFLVPPKNYADKIWICWFQGEENAPDLVKKCIASVRSNCSGRDVIILTDENICDYVSLPVHVVKKYEEGKISRTHFSDIVRMNLIAQQGGLWVDATIFMTRKLDSRFFDVDFLSLRNTTVSSHTFIMGYWTGYFFYAKRNHDLVCNCALLLNQYWLEQSVLIDYFLIDYTIKKSICDLNFEEELKKLPVIGNNRWLLHREANKVASPDSVKLFEEDKIGIYKMTYKSKYKLSRNGKSTIFKFIIEDGAKFG